MDDEPISHELLTTLDTFGLSELPEESRKLALIYIRNVTAVSRFPDDVLRVVVPTASMYLAGVMMAYHGGMTEGEVDQASDKARDVLKELLVSDSDGI